MKDNARVINNIISVPNKIELKRNQIFNENFITHLSELDDGVKKTFINLDQLVDDLKTNNLNEKKNSKMINNSTFLNDQNECMVNIHNDESK